MRGKYYDFHGNEVVPPEGATAEIRVGAYAAVIDGRGMLFVRGAKSGKLELPGGAVEPGESFAETVRREGLEETGYALDILAGPFHVDGPRGFHPPHLERFYWAVSMTFLATASSEPVSAPHPDQGEVDGVVWVDAVALYLDSTASEGSSGSFLDIHPVCREAVRLILLSRFESA